MVRATGGDGMLLALYRPNCRRGRRHHFFGRCHGQSNNYLRPRLNKVGYDAAELVNTVMSTLAIGSWVVLGTAKGEALVLLAACELNLEAVRSALAAAGLPNLWIPKLVVRIEKIPVRGTGKTDLRACRDAALAAADRSRG